MSGADHIAAVCGCDGQHPHVPQLSEGERSRIRAALDRASTILDVVVAYETRTGREARARVTIYPGEG